MPIIDMKATGNNIKKMMKDRGMKVRDIQDACGFGTPQAIFKWFRGDCMPAIDNMVIIAAIFNCRVDDIIVTRVAA